MTSSSASTANSNNYSAGTTSSLSSSLSASNLVFNKSTVASPYIFTDNYVDIFSDFDNPIASAIILYYTEDELRSFLDDLKTKKLENELYQDVVKTIIRGRHLSEKFILDYLDIDSSKIENYRSTIFKKHSADILSGEYAQLALMFELTK